MEPTATQRRAWLGALTRAQALAPGALRPALQALDVVPTAAQWLRYAQGLLLAGGAGLMAAGVVFFVAFNWSELTRMHKFVLVQGVLVVAAGAAVWFGLERAAGRAALVAGVLVLGALLALFGQTYQTGADSWELFATWALLALPWTVSARSAVLWCVWLLVVNVAVGLWFGQMWSPHGMPGLGQAWRAGCVGITVLNLCAAGVGYLFSGCLRDKPALLWRAAVLGSMAACVAWALTDIWSAPVRFDFVWPVGIIVVVAVIFDRYAPDVSAAAFVYGAAVVVSAALMARMLERAGLTYFGYGLVALGVVGLTVGAVRRLQNIGDRALEQRHE